MTAFLELAAVTCPVCGLPPWDAPAPGDEVCLGHGPQEACGHVWPAELTPDAECAACGLAYAEWSEEDSTQ